MNYSAPSRRFGQQSAKAYAQVGLETQVLSASPEHLITLLFNGARAAIMQARLHMENGNIAGRGQAISKALDIVDSGLKMSVDQEKGGELASNLIVTYDIIIRNLLLANLHNDSDKLSLAERMLIDIADAWSTSVDPQRAQAPA